MEKEFYFECGRLLSKQKIPGFDIKKFLVLAEESGDNLVFSAVSKFIKENPII